MPAPTVNSFAGRITVTTPGPPGSGAVTLATQADAEAGTNNVKTMTPLRVAQAIAELAPTAPAIASQAEAEAGTDNQKMMTPLRVAEAIAELAAANPVLASQAEAEAGTENTKTMTPLRVAQAIAALETVGATPTIASEAEAEAGTNNTKMMTPLRVADALSVAPVSTAQAVADTAAAAAGAASAVATSAAALAAGDEALLVYINKSAVVPAVVPDWNGTTGTSIHTVVAGAIANGDKRIRLPKGDFALSTKISVPEGVILEGIGETSAVVHYTGADYAFENIRTSDLLKPGRISNLTIYGPSSAGLIKLSNLYRTRVDDVVLRNTPGNALYLLNQSSLWTEGFNGENIMVRDCGVALKGEVSGGTNSFAELNLKNFSVVLTRVGSGVFEFGDGAYIYGHNITGKINVEVPVASTPTTTKSFLIKLGDDTKLVDGYIGMLMELGQDRNYNRFVVGYNSIINGYGFLKTQKATTMSYNLDATHSYDFVRTSGLVMVGPDGSFIPGAKDMTDVVRIAPGHATLASVSATANTTTPVMYVSGGVVEAVLKYTGTGRDHSLTLLIDAGTGGATPTVTVLSNRYTTTQVFDPANLPRISLSTVKGNAFLYVTLINTVSTGSLSIIATLKSYETDSGDSDFGTQKPFVLFPDMTGISVGSPVAQSRDLQPITLASQAEAEEGTENTKTMTPLRVAQAIAELASGAAPEIASQAEAEAGTDNTKMMTSLRVAQAIALLNDVFQGVATISATAPSITGLKYGHKWYQTTTGIEWSLYFDGTTASWVDFNGVHLATQAEAEAGTENTKGMTPLRTAQAIAALSSGGTADAVGTIKLWATADLSNRPAGYLVCDGTNGTEDLTPTETASYIVKGGGTVATPTFSPAASGSPFSAAQNVTISCATSGVTIKYTVDGSTPSRSVGTTYSAAVAISTTATLKAIAYRNNYVDSSVASGTYTITIPVPPELVSIEIVTVSGVEYADLTFDREVVVTGSLGLAFTASGGALTGTLSSGGGTDTLRIVLARRVAGSETVTCTHTQAGNGIEADDDGTDVATFTDEAITNSSTYSSGSVPTPDVLHWPLNDSSGSTIAALVGGGTAACTGTLNGDYLSMATGNGNFQSTGNITWGSDVVTVAFWMRISSWGGSQSGAFLRSCYVASTPRFELIFDGGNLRASITGTSGGMYEQSYLPFAVDTWVHIAIVLDNSTNEGSTKFYLNGSLQTWDFSTSSKASTGNFATDQLSFKSIFAEASFFDMDDLRIYGSEVASGDIAAIHSAGRPS